MTRQEEIRKAVDIQFPIVLDGRTQEQALAASGFELGVKWADKHPINVWHDVSEEPDIEDTYVYILYIDKYDCPRLQLLNDIITYYDNKTTWNEAVKLCGISKWAYLRDLLPN